MSNGLRLVTRGELEQGLGSNVRTRVRLDLSHGSSQGSCQCLQQHGEDTAVFYNRVPKCGSTTMLR